MATLIQNLTSKTEESFLISWECDENVEELFYSIDGGETFTQSTQTGKSGVLPFEDLSAGTVFEVELKAYVTDSTIPIFTPVLEVKTYDYPFCEFSPDFTIGQRLTLTMYNPLNREITVNLIGNDESVISTDTITGRIITGFIDETTINRLYMSIPNSSQGVYYVKTSFEGHDPVIMPGGVYSVDEKQSTPLIGNVSYHDTVEEIIQITGDNKFLVRNKSIPFFEAEDISARNFATISQVKVILNSYTYNLTFENGSASGFGGTVNSSLPIYAIFEVVDSRGLITQKEKLVNIYNWFEPEALISLKRDEDPDYGKIKVDANYAKIGNRNVLVINYYKKKSTDVDYTFVGTLTSGVETSFAVEKEFDWDIKVTLNDLLNIEKTYLKTLQRNSPLMFFDPLKYSVGIDCYPQNLNTLEIKGKDIYNSLFYSSNETFTIINNLYCPGILIYNEVFFTIPLPKNALYVTPVITVLKLNACKNSSGFLFSGGSYITGGYDVLSDSNLTVTVLKETPNGLMIKIHSNISISETNMTQVIVELNAVTVTFT